MTFSSLLPAVRAEIDQVHDFFTRWFNGSAAREELAEYFEPRLHQDLVFISPDGNHLGRDGLLGMFKGAHGSNLPFSVKIKDVRLVHDLGDHLIATYTEWQRAAKSSANPNNGRLTSVVLSKSEPFIWFHIHETWLPQEIQDSEPYDF